MSVCFWTAHTLKQAWADEQFVVPAPPNTSAFMQSLLCQCWKPTVSGCIGAHSGSHTHSEPRIVIIFSELLQIDRQTEWVDRQMCTQTDREREDQIGNQEQGWKQGPKLKQANRCPMQETDHHCWNYTGQKLQWIKALMYLNSYSYYRMADRGETARKRKRGRMPWTPILNWTSPKAQAETFCQIYQRQHKTAFKPPHTSLLQRYDPSRHPEGLQPSSRYFSSPVLLSQCHRAKRVMLRRRKHWGATERAIQVTDVLKWDKYPRTVSRALCGGL